VLLYLREIQLKNSKLNVDQMNHTQANELSFKRVINIFYYSYIDKLSCIIQISNYLKNDLNKMQLDQFLFCTQMTSENQVINFLKRILVNQTEEKQFFLFNPQYLENLIQASMITFMQKLHLAYWQKSCNCLNVIVEKDYKSLTVRSSFLFYLLKKEWIFEKELNNNNSSIKETEKLIKQKFYKFKYFESNLQCMGKSSSIENQIRQLNGFSQEKISFYDGIEFDIIKAKLKLIFIQQEQKKEFALIIELCEFTDEWIKELVENLICSLVLFNGIIIKDYPLYFPYLKAIFFEFGFSENIRNFKMFEVTKKLIRNLCPEKDYIEKIYDNNPLYQKSQIKTLSKSKMENCYDYLIRHITLFCPTLSHKYNEEKKDVPDDEFLSLYSRLLFDLYFEKERIYFNTWTNFHIIRKLLEERCFKLRNSPYNNKILGRLSNTKKKNYFDFEGKILNLFIMISFNNIPRSYLSEQINIISKEKECCKSFENDNRCISWESMNTNYLTFSQ